MSTILQILSTQQEIIRTLRVRKHCINDLHPAKRLQDVRGCSRAVQPCNRLQRIRFGPSPPQPTSLSCRTSEPWKNPKKWQWQESKRWGQMLHCSRVFGLPALASSLHDHRALPSNKCHHIQTEASFAGICRIQNGAVVWSLETNGFSERSKWYLGVASRNSRPSISQRPFSQVARCPTHHEQVYQAERTSMPPPNVQTKTRHSLHKASCCPCFFKKLWKSHFLPLKIFVKHQVIRSLFHLWTDHDYHHGSICPLQQTDQSHFVTNAMTCQGSSRSTLWQTWGEKIAPRN